MWADKFINCSVCMQVGSLLKSKPLAPVSTYDIEQDCIRLLSTGLFQSVRPKLNRPGIVVSVLALLPVALASTLLMPCTFSNPKPACLLPLMRPAMSRLTPRAAIL